MAISKEKRGKGRPVIKFGNGERALITEHCATLNLKQTADLLGVDILTLKAVFLRQPQFAQLHRSVKLKANLEVVAMLKRICIEDRNVAAITLWLKANHDAFKESAFLEAEADEKVLVRRFDSSVDGDNSHLAKIEKWQEENLDEDKTQH